ncbi:apotyrosinase chaperone MelC1 [Streptomyces poriticola]|uniref:apotyrosinase chaperone MelC1 n=1 Tax=Streptomyces poriticola TaxID=3120506 RepID=UPI002FCE5CC4
MPELTRRRALSAAAAVAAGAGATAAGLTAGGARAAAAADDRHAHTPGAFDEVYRGRRIQGRPVDGGAHHHHGAGYAVFVDGMELHLMRNADGTWISVISHYDPVPTPRAAARAAVEELQGAPLVPFSAPAVH